MRRTVLGLWPAAPARLRLWAIAPGRARRRCRSGSRIKGVNRYNPGIGATRGTPEMANQITDTAIRSKTLRDNGIRVSAVPAGARVTAQARARHAYPGSRLNDRRRLLPPRAHEPGN